MAQSEAVRNGESLDIGYLVEAEVEQNEQIIASERSRLGRFVLASNDRTINGEPILQYYKGQNAVDKGFRFLKDKSFRVAEVYLKKEERIEALSMIMVLSLSDLLHCGMDAQKTVERGW
jgi:transposase